MFRQLKRMLSLLLVFVMLFQITIPVLAQNESNVDINWDFTELLDNFEEIETFVSEVEPADLFNELPPEAQALLLNHMQSYDRELLEFYNEYIAENGEELTFTPSRARNTAAANTMLSRLSTNLNQIAGLTPAIRNALMGAGASIITAIGTGVQTLGVGAIVGILGAAAFSAVIIMNWNVVSSRWNAITNAFVNAFTGHANAGTLNNVRNGFGQSRTNTTTTTNDKTHLRSRFRSGTLTVAASNHMDAAFLRNMMQRVPVEIYYSQRNRTALFMFSVPNGLQARAPQRMSQNRVSSTPARNMGGATLFVIFNVANGNIVHAHLRTRAAYISQDRDAIRRRDGMNWRILPTPIQRNSVFDIPNESISRVRNGNQW